MGPSLESDFQSMMAASYGANWELEVRLAQIIDMRRAFMGGAVATLSQIPIDVAATTPLRQQCQEFLSSVGCG